MAKFRMRPVHILNLQASYATFQSAQRAMGVIPLPIEVTQPEEVEAYRNPTDSSREVPPADVERPRMLAWCKDQGLKAKGQKDGSITVGDLTVQPGQWLVLGPDGPHVLDQQVVTENFQGV